MAITPRDLGNLCKLQLRNSLFRNLAVKQMPLPDKLKIPLGKVLHLISASQTLYSLELTKLYFITRLPSQEFDEAILKRNMMVCYACSAFITARGLISATLSSANAGPSGLLRPCSQFCKVSILTPII